MDTTLENTAEAAPDAQRIVVTLRQAPGGTSSINLGIDFRAEPCVQAPSGRVPPGGYSQVAFNDVKPSAKNQHFQPDFRSIPGAQPELVASFVQELDHPAPRSTAAAMHSGQAIDGGEAATTKRIGPPTPSKLALTDEGLLWPEGPQRSPEKKVSEAKQRELFGSSVASIINGEAPPSPSAAAAPPSPGPAAPPSPGAAKESSEDMEAADGKYVNNMSLPELRAALRERGLSPAGNKTHMVERLTEALAGGAVAPLLVPRRRTGGLSTGAISNNYARAEGQNLGNFLTDRPSSRCTRPAGGASQIVFGDEGPQQQPAGFRARPASAASAAQRKELASTAFEAGTVPAAPVRPGTAARVKAMGGQDVIASQSTPIEPAPISAAKLAELKGAIDESMLATQARDAQGLELSRAKLAEFKGGMDASMAPALAPAAGHLELSKAKLAEFKGTESLFTGGEAVSATNAVIAANGSVVLVRTGTEAGTLSEGKLREINGTRGAEGSEAVYRPRTAPSKEWRQEFGHKNVFSAEEAAAMEQTAAMKQKQKELTSAVVFSDSMGRPGRASTKVSHAPGGDSQIVFG